MSNYLKNITMSEQAKNTSKKKKSIYFTNEQSLNNYDAIFTNISQQPLIQSEMAQYGYDEAKIKEGKALADAARKAYTDNKRETAESVAAYAEVDKVINKLLPPYTAHRKAAKVALRKDPAAVKQLGINGREPDAMAARIEQLENFYTQLENFPEIAKQVETMKVTPEETAKIKPMVAEYRTARAKYLLEKGESQDATKTKDAAFKAMESWLSDFFAVAKIAMEDHPQLLESLTKIIKS